MFFFIIAEVVVGFISAINLWAYTAESLILFIRSQEEQEQLLWSILEHIY